MLVYVSVVVVIPQGVFITILLKKSNGEKSLTLVNTGFIGKIVCLCSVHTFEKFISVGLLLEREKKTNLYSKCSV